jgi:hypothetical protein
MRRLTVFALPAVALISGAIACNTTGGQPDPTPEPDLSYVSEESLEATTAYLASDELAGRNDGTEGSAAARAWLIEQMQACGIAEGTSSGYEQPITTGDGVNILGIVWGTDASLDGEPLVLSAHYDHLGMVGGQMHKGAYDNAAGVASVLGVGCALAKAPPKRPLLIAFWDAEEPPTFLTSAMGSQYFADNPVFPLEDLAGVIVLDLVGAELWPGFMGHTMLGAELSPEIAAAVDATAVPDGLMALRAGLHLVEQTPFGQQPWSDYHAFRQRQVPVLFLSDGQNKRYHTPEDTMEGIRTDKLALESRMYVDMVTAIADGPKPTFVASGFDAERDVLGMTALLEAALADGGLVDTLGLSAQSRASLEADLGRVSNARSELETSGSLSSTSIGGLRGAAQRIMCLAGSDYTEAMCSAL